MVCLEFFWCPTSPTYLDNKSKVVSLWTAGRLYISSLSHNLIQKRIQLDWQCHVWVLVSCKCFLHHLLLPSLESSWVACGFSFLLLSTTPTLPPFPFAWAPSIVSLPFALPFLQPGSCSLRSPHLHSIPRMSFLAAALQGWEHWGAFGALSLNPLAERSSHMAGLPFRLLRAGLEWPGLAGRSIPSQWPAHLWQRAGSGSAMGMPGCTSAYSKRNVVILSFRGRDKWLETKLPGFFGPALPCPPFSVLPTFSSSQGKIREDRTFTLVGMGLNVTMKPLGEREKGEWILGWAEPKMHGIVEREDFFCCVLFFPSLNTEQQMGLWVANGKKLDFSIRLSNLRASSNPLCAASWKDAASVLGTKRY